MRLLIITSVLCLLGLGILVSSSRADEAASNAVKQSFLAMRSVHSFRDKWQIRNPGSADMDMSSVSERIETPRLMHELLTFGSDKTERVRTTDTVYTHEAKGRWNAKPLGHPWNGPWNQAWLKRYDPAATYLFVRHDVFDGVPVNVYVCTARGTWAGSTHIDNVIWIGAHDHLPRRIVSRDTDAHGVLLSTAVETLSDFNAPIKITVPTIAH